MATHSTLKYVASSGGGDPRLMLGRVMTELMLAGAVNCGAIASLTIHLSAARAPLERAPVDPRSDPVCPFRTLI